MRVALVHDYLTQRGGAERVVVSLTRLFPGAPVFTSLYDSEGTYPDFERVDVRPSFLQRLPHEGDSFRALLPLYPAAFESLRLRDYDLVISSSSGWAHGVRTGDARHLWYCYTPARWLHRPDQYMAGATVPRPARPLLPPVLAALRRWDRAAARRPDRIVGIAGHIADRIRWVYGRDADVIHPPVEVERIAAAGPFPPPDEPYHLVVSRLLPYKRVDLAVRAARVRGERVVVVGDGPERPAIEALAGPGVDLRRTVGDDELVRLLHGCTSLIHAGEEDFGLTPLEANAAGRPAVTVARGGALETLVDGTTGVLFHEQTVEAVASALGRVQSTSWDRDAIVAHARSFREERFHRELTAVVEEMMSAR